MVARDFEDDAGKNVNFNRSGYTNDELDDATSHHSQKSRRSNNSRFGGGIKPTH